LFTISVNRTFPAYHALALADGSREPVHEHNWRAVAAVSSEKLDKTGFVMDFHQLEAIVSSVTSKLAGHKLEQLDYFERKNISAENVARYIYERIKDLLPNGCKLEWVKVTEASGCNAKYSP